MKTKLTLVLLGLVSLPAVCLAKPSQDDITAAMIYRLTKFVEWPAQAFSNPNTDFLICFDKKGPVFNGLTNVQSRLWRGRVMKVRAELSEQCNVAFLSNQTKGLPHSHVLTISRRPDFLDTGGHIALEFSKGRIVFRVNRTAAMAAGLTLSSDFLNLAKEVR